jgi:DNA-binding response OmpR family regulator
MAMRVLVIDDDAELSELLTEYLRREGFETEATYDGEAGLRRALLGGYDMVVLDVMLPGLGGFEVLRRLRAASTVPVVMLTARGDEVDRVVGLEIGADDYLAKPFSSRELVARIRAVLRRAPNGSSPSAPAASTAREIVRVGDVELEHAARAVRRGGETVELTAIEFDLLDLLLRCAGEVVSREEIARTVLDRPLMPYDRSIDVHVSNLRRKLGPHSDSSERIKTLRGVGYLYARLSSRDGTG